MNFVSLDSGNITQYADYNQKTNVQIPSYTISSQESSFSPGRGQKVLEASQVAYVQLADSLHEQLDPPHLILFLDINQTILLGDIVQNKSPKDAVNDALTDLVVDCWEPHLPEMSYNNYVKTYLCPNPTKDPAIQARQKEILSNFVTFLEEAQHPKHGEIKTQYDQAVAALEKQDGKIFASFYKMVRHLNEKKIPYTIVFRTFGGDAPEVIKELNQRLGEDFAVYKGRYAELEFQNPQAFYEYCKEVKKQEGHHILIRDNYDEWNKHNREGAYGKPFPMDLKDSKYLPLFFDDNAALIPGKPQMNAVAPYDLQNGKLIDPKDAIDMKRLFVVSPLDALHDPDYFINHIDAALAYRKSELAQLSPQ
jgi:hypothetical protein